MLEAASLACLRMEHGEFIVKKMAITLRIELEQAFDKGLNGEILLKTVCH